MARKLKGLTSAEVIASREQNGSNDLKKERKTSFLHKFISNLGDPIIKILLGALAVQVLLTIGNINYPELIGILSAILISTSVSTISEHRSERAFEKLESDNLGTVSVERDGIIKKIPANELVVGDIVYLYSGEKIYADGTVLEGQISVDQSALNGESREVVKRPGKTSGWDLSAESRVFRGTEIVDGNCVMVVGRVGDSTYFGMVAKDVQAETRISPLKLRLTRLASQVSKIGYIVAAVVGLAFLFSTLVMDNGFDPVKIKECVVDYKYLFSVLLSTLTLMITVIVVAAPEGLPMMITVVLSANMKRMLRDNVQVKKLVGIDTAGSINILFTDKTGTITEGVPRCDRIFCCGEEFAGLSPIKKHGGVFEKLLLSAKYNTDITELGGTLAGGNATDRAIYELFSEYKCPDRRILSRVPFSSDKKYSSVTLEGGATLIKGAPEIIISSAEYQIDREGGYIPLNQSEIRRKCAAYMSEGARVVAVGEICGHKTALIGLIVMKDKIRKGVCEAVERVKTAGIIPVMITGDSKETADAIARDAGIYAPALGHISVSATELNNLTDDGVKALLPKLRVVSRAMPRDKSRLVRLSQEMNMVVGMTGDGINDAPSLKLADVGFAMGSGTDIAKSSADIVILDNSFTAIAKTVLYGRTIFKSIRKFITFQLVMNLCACGVSLIGQFVGVDTPITIIQMLWVNIIMDTLGGLAFAGEGALDYYMKEKPKSRDEPILSREMLGQIFLNGAFTLLLCIVFLTSPIIRVYYGFSNSPEAFYTAFYALFIFSGIFNCLLARCERLRLMSNIGKNKPFILILLLISLIQVCMIYYGGETFRCTPLSPSELGYAVGMAFLVVPFDMMRRIISRLR